MPIFVCWLVCLFLVCALFQPNKAVGMQHVGGPGLNPGRSQNRVHYQKKMPLYCLFKTLPQARPDDREVALIGKGNHNIADLIIVT